MMMKAALVIIMLFESAYLCQIQEREICLATNGEARITISIPDQPSSEIHFASAELARYLEKICCTCFPIKVDNPNIEGPVIKLVLSEGLAQDAYSISSDSKDIILTGNSYRALLYAIYDFLERLGCQWLAPDFSFYHGRAEFIPEKKFLYFPADITIKEEPVFTYRKLDVGEGRSLDVVSLEKIIAWLPKVRLNTVMIPLNMNQMGRTVWEDYRVLVPELEKRGIIIEVGQHGYQNFLNARMEGGSIFEQHPDWFGKDINCQPNPSDESIFNIENPEAIDYFIRNVLKYLDSHPEIKVIDIWPPDYAKWAECPDQKLDMPHLRQASLVEQVREAVRKNFPDVRVQMIAFANTLEPVSVHRDILVDVCPIDQSFEKQIYDTASLQNKLYADAIRGWRDVFKGDLGIYTYYRKYAWRSLPNIIPHYMQKDLKWFAEIPLQSISCYAEPGDWYTYELNHYILAKLEWNPHVNVDSLISTFCCGRFDNSYEEAKEALTTLETTVRFFGNIRNTSLKTVGEINDARRKIQDQIENLCNLRLSKSHETLGNVEKLILMLQYADMDLDIQMARASGVEDKVIINKLNELILFQSSHAGMGIFIYDPNIDIDKLRRHYNR